MLGGDRFHCASRPWSIRSINNPSVSNKYSLRNATRVPRSPGSFSAFLTVLTGESGWRSARSECSGFEPSPALVQKADTEPLLADFGRWQDVAWRRETLALH